MDAAEHAHQQPPAQKKPPFPVVAGLRRYLAHYRRERELPVSYAQLLDFHEAIPLTDANGHPTLWDSVIYRADEMPALYEGLKRIYALLKVDGDFSVVEHLYVDRVDFCSFGNSTPFRVRIVNAYNDNQDYFYIKKADASRVYGLELEHLLSPNRLNFLTSGSTLVEEHIVGIPGDIFISDWLDDNSLRPVRVAKEMVKFNERCFMRLLGDMRSYNYVVVVTPDFEGSQLRIRAMDFDQQSFNGAKNFYLPQFFKENAAVVRYCTKHLHVQTALQYRREEQALFSSAPNSRLSDWATCLIKCRRMRSHRLRKSTNCAPASPSTTSARSICSANPWARSCARILNRSGCKSAVHSVPSCCPA